MPALGGGRGGKTVPHELQNPLLHASKNSRRKPGRAQRRFLRLLTEHMQHRVRRFSLAVVYTRERLEFLLNPLAAVRNGSKVRAPAPGPIQGPKPHVTGNRCTTVQAGGSS